MLPKRKYNCAIARLHPSQLKIVIIAEPVARISSTVDLRHKLPPVYDQGTLGSCTANALCAAFEYDAPGYMGSRLFLYYNERLLEGDVPDDNGAFLSTGINSMKKYGICPESDHPYVPSKFAVKPLAKCYTNALKHRVITARNILPTLASMKACLSSGFPFVVGISIFDSFESDAVAITGIVPMPLPTETKLGGHAVLVCGYNDKQKWFIVRNSWGTQWGDKGYFYLPYAYLINPNWSSDLWNITSVISKK